MLLQIAHGEEPHTPLAGQEHRTEMSGQDVFVPARDRRHVTAVNFGLQWLPHGPTPYEVLPFGALFVWRSSYDDTERFRGTFSGLVNDVKYNIGLPSMRGVELVLTLESLVIPFGRSEYVEGRRITQVDLQWNHIHGGVGIGYRRLLPPGHQDSALEVALTYEPGFIWFKRSSGTAANFIVPNDTYEGRVHFRLRTDVLDRNLMELAHRGFSAGGDVLYGQRARWREWGAAAFNALGGAQEKNYLTATVYGVAAGGVPFVESERHRLISSVYGGLGQDLDRFSAFRLPGRPTGYEWEALSLPIMPAVAFNELFPRRYGIVDLTYRYEALFFLYPYLRGTWGIVERPRFGPNGTIRNEMGSLPALGGGVVSGAPWKSQVEINYSYNFGIFRDHEGQPTRGGNGIFIFWSKLL
ncbi:MAG: hypothetical protein E6K60_12695 [Nitrospirae bacterium]|nr:MAG: hypothetical protein E6K60_12695 [Nitrospirota bacterium]